MTILWVLGIMWAAWGAGLVAVARKNAAAAAEYGVIGAFILAAVTIFVSFTSIP